MESGAGSNGDRVCWVSPGPLWGCAGAVGKEAPLALRECVTRVITLLHCRERTTPAPRPALVGLWAQTWQLPGAQMAPGHCTFSGTGHCTMPCWSPGQGGRPPSQLWGQAVWHPWAQPSRVPLGPGSPVTCAAGRQCPRCSHLISSLQRAPACRLSPKSLSQRLMAVVDLPPALHPCHLWAPTPEPPIPCTALSLSG